MDTPKLLTADEEVQLARVMRAGRERTGPHTYRYVTPEAIAARETFAAHNRRLVESVAARYSSKPSYKSHGVPWVDLVAAGNVGLVQAIDRFDPKRGNRFSTMAIWWIRKAISQEVNREHMIRTTSWGKPPIPVESLDADDEMEEYRETLIDPQENVEQQTVAAEDQREDGGALLDVMLAHLSPIQRYVIAAHYGFDGWARSYDQIAAETAKINHGAPFSVSRIRAIEREALEHLRAVLGVPKIIGIWQQERLAWPA